MKSGTIFEILLLFAAVLGMAVNVPGAGSILDYLRDRDFTELFLLMSVVLISLYVIIRILADFPVILRIIILVLDVVIVVLGLYGMEIHKAVMAIAIALTLTETQRVISGLSGYPSTWGLRWISLFVFLEIFSFIIPSSSEPIDWSFIYRVGYTLRDGVESFIEDTGYFFSGIGSGGAYQSGYSTLQNVQAGIRSNNREELYVTAVHSGRSLYLVGNVEGGDEAVAADVADDLEGRRLLDFLYALYSHDVNREEAKLYASVCKMTVEYGYLRTADIIRPSELLRIEYGKNDSKNALGTGFEKVHKKGNAYDLMYLSIDYGSPYLEKIMRDPVSVPYPDYITMSEYCQKMYDFQLDRSVSAAEYSEWSTKKRDISSYLISDEPATDRMKTLAADLAAGAETDYDICRAVEKYLRQYKYNMNPAQGTSENFVDAFLFETGEGYCIHFASAMVELLRLDGIPARFVQGYGYQFKGNKQGTKTIMGSNAHAWAEAYIDGIGWIPFEPTAGRTTSIDNTWKRYLPEDDPERITVDTAYSEKDLQTVVPELPDAVSDAILNEEAESASSEKVRYVDVMIILHTAGMVLLTALFYILLALLLIILIRFLRYRNSPMERKFDKNVRDIRKLLSKQFPVYGRQPLLEDYMALMPEDEVLEYEQLEITDMKQLMSHISDVYYRQRFAGITADGTDVRDAEYLRKHLIKRAIRKFRLRRHT